MSERAVPAIRKCRKLSIFFWGFISVGNEINSVSRGSNYLGKVYSDSQVLALVGTVESMYTWTTISLLILVGSAIGDES